MARIISALWNKHAMTGDGDRARAVLRQPVAKPTRRAILKSAAASAFVIGMPFVRPAAAAPRHVKIATLGGYFQRNLIDHLYPEFEKATGIKVETIADPGAAESVIQLGATIQDPAAVDLCTASQEQVARGAAAKLWRTLDTGRIPNLRYIQGRFIHQSEAGVDAIGAMAWYQTLVANPKAVGPLPTSWKILWESGRSAAWGLASGGRSALFEITAATWFGGNAILDTEDGIRQVVAKIEELKPNVKLWWESEGMMQDAYESEEIVGGMYFHDVAGRMARDGTEIASIFPAEGGVIDFGSWCQPASSTKIEEAQEFIDFMSAPATQAMMTRKIGTAPLVDRALTDLTEAEFATASSDRPPIAIATAARLRSLELMNRQFARMLTS